MFHFNEIRIPEHLTSSSLCQQRELEKKQEYASEILRPFLDRNRALVLDGGLATELETKGANIADELWSARLLRDDPLLIGEAHFTQYPPLHLIETPTIVDVYPTIANV